MANGEALTETRPYGDETQALIDNLRTAHTGYAEAETQHADRIKELGQQISVLTAEKGRLEAQQRSSRSLYNDDRHTYAFTLRSRAKKLDADMNPVYAATLAAAAMDQGSFWYPQTFEETHRLGIALTQFDTWLRAQEEPRPVVSVKASDNRHQIKLIDDISFGMTLPGEGLQSEVLHVHSVTCGCGAQSTSPEPSLKIPVDSATLGTLRLDHRSRYELPDGQVIRYENGKPEAMTGYPSRPLPSRQPKIKLPEGDVYMNDRMHLLSYGSQEVTSIDAAPKTFDRESIVNAVGEAAVIQLLAHYLNRQDIEVLKAVRKDMTKFIGRCLGITFKTIETAK